MMERTRGTGDVSRLLWGLGMAAVMASAGVILATQTGTASTRDAPGPGGVLYVQFEAPGMATAIYKMPRDSRMRDLFHAARVPLPRSRDGMEALLPGQALKVEGDGGLSSAWMAGDQMVALGVPIPINECGLQDLVAIPGVGEATALKILKARMEHGRYDSFSEMADLTGIGEKTLMALREYGRL